MYLQAFAIVLSTRIHTPFFHNAFWAQRSALNFSSNGLYAYMPICLYALHFLTSVTGSFRVNLWFSDVTKESKILKFQNSDIAIDFLTPQNILIPNLRSKQSFYRVLSGIIVFLVNFGSFRVNLGVSDVTKGSKMWKFQNSNKTIRFLIQKPCPYQIWDQNNHFIGYYCVLGEFQVI